MFNITSLETIDQQVPDLSPTSESSQKLSQQGNDRPPASYPKPVPISDTRQSHLEIPPLTFPDFRALEHSPRKMITAMNESQFDQKVQDMVVSGAIDKDLYNFSDWVDPRKLKQLGHAIMEGDDKKVKTIEDSIKDKSELARTLGVLKQLGVHELFPKPHQLPSGADNQPKTSPATSDNTPSKPAPLTDNTSTTTASPTDNTSTTTASPTDNSADTQAADSDDSSDTTAAASDQYLDDPDSTDPQTTGAMLADWRALTCLDTITSDIKGKVHAITKAQLQDGLKELQKSNSQPYEQKCLNYLIKNFDRLSDSTSPDGTKAISLDNLHQRVDSNRDNLLVRMVAGASNGHFTEQDRELIQQLLPIQAVENNPNLINNLNQRLAALNSPNQLYYESQPATLASDNMSGGRLDLVGANGYVSDYVDLPSVI